MIWFLALFLGGTLLFLLELYLPGGVLGAIGGGMILGSIIYAFRYFPEWRMQIIMGEILVVIGVFFLWAKTFHRTRMGKKLILEEKIKGREPEEISWLGKEGITLTPLRPVGIALIDGRRKGVIAEGLFIEKGKRVRVTGVKGKELLVREIEEKGGKKNG